MEAATQVEKTGGLDQKICKMDGHCGTVADGQFCLLDQRSHGAAVAALKKLLPCLSLVVGRTGFREALLFRGLDEGCQSTLRMPWQAGLELQKVLKFGFLLGGLHGHHGLQDSGSYGSTIYLIDLLCTFSLATFKRATVAVDVILFRAPCSLYALPLVLLAGSNKSAG